MIKVPSDRLATLTVPRWNRGRESLPPMTLVGITAQATDPDPGDSVSYLTLDSAGGLFQIDSGTGVISVANALDFETATSHW